MVTSNLYPNFSYDHVQNTLNTLVWVFRALELGLKAVFSHRDIIPGMAELVARKSHNNHIVLKQVCYEITLSSVLTEAISFLLNTVQSNESSYGLAKLHYTVTQGGSPCPCLCIREMCSLASNLCVAAYFGFPLNTALSKRICLVTWIKSHSYSKGFSHGVFIASFFFFF